MPRRKKKDLTRVILPDPRYNSVVVQKLINVVMERGKKDLAAKIVYSAMDMLAQKAGSERAGYELFEKALAGVRPVVEVRSRRVGGGVYQVPTEVREVRAKALAYRWLLGAAAKRSDKTMGARLGNELLDAVEGRGGAIKKKSDIHRMAEANRAFSHYAW